MSGETQCIVCGEYLSRGRWEIGKRTCLACGEKEAVKERMGWCVVPMHKSNYMLVREKELLVGMNNKGGLVK